MGHLMWLHSINDRSTSVVASILSNSALILHNPIFNADLTSKNGIHFIFIILEKVNLNLSIHHFRITLFPDSPSKQK